MSKAIYLVQKEGVCSFFLFCSHSQLVRVRLSPCELENSHFNIHAEGQGSLTKAVNSSGQRNRSSMESILAPPCYSSFDVHVPCLGPVSCSFSS